MSSIWANAEVMLKSAALICALACVAHAQPSSRWTSVSLGAGPYAVSMRGDTVYGGGGQVVGRIGYAWATRPAYAYEIEALGSHDFGAGDCIPGFSICAPALHFVGASANVVWQFGRPIQADRGGVTSGLGLFRIAPTENQKVSPQAALGVNVGAEAPFIAGSKAGMTIGLRGLAFPFVHGQSVYMGLLTLGFRRW